MNDDRRADEMFEIEPVEAGGVLAHLPWWLILAIAFAVTELTAHPAIGVSVLCLKFGWNDFRTSLWLRRRDPNRRRGAINSWFYLASGLWRVCLWSFALMFLAIMFLIAWEGPVLQRAGQPDGGPVMPPEVMTCMSVWMASFAAATMLTLLAIGLALRRRTKVWISRSVGESRRANQWPPRPTPGRRTEFNLLKWWTIGTGVGLFVFLFFVGITVFMLVWDAMRLGPGQANGNPAGAAIFGAVVGVGLPIGSSLLIVWLGGWVIAQIGARSLEECWPGREPQFESEPSG